jgi:glutathionyl-hydroquinone reductase
MMALNLQQQEWMRHIVERRIIRLSKFITVQVVHSICSSKSSSMMALNLQQQQQQQQQQRQLHYMYVTWQMLPVDTLQPKA